MLYLPLCALVDLPFAFIFYKVPVPDLAVCPWVVEGLVWCLYVCVCVGGGGGGLTAFGVPWARLPE